MAEDESTNKASALSVSLTGQMYSGIRGWLVLSCLENADAVQPNRQLAAGSSRQTHLQVIALISRLIPSDPLCLRNPRTLRLELQNQPRQPFDP